MAISSPTPHPTLNPLAPPFSPTQHDPQNTTWSKKLFSLHHIPEIQRLDFFPPIAKGEKLVTICSKNEVEATEDSWKQALQGFFADKRPYLKSVLIALQKIWNLQGSMEIYPRLDDSIIFTFTSMEDRRRVLESGPWFILGRYFHLRPWSREIRGRRDFFGTMPVWIRLPNLPLQFWSPGSISRIASGVGKPLFLDEKTASASKLQFVRVCVEALASHPPPKSVFVEVEGEENSSHEQIIEYESIFKICTKCSVFGHSEDKCENVFKLKPTLQHKRHLPKQLGGSVQPLELTKNFHDSIAGTVEKQDTNILKPTETNWTVVSKKKKKNRNRKKGPEANKLASEDLLHSKNFGNLMKDGLSYAKQVCQADHLEPEDETEPEPEKDQAEGAGISTAKECRSDHSRDQNEAKKFFDDQVIPYQCQKDFFNISDLNQPEVFERETPEFQTRGEDFLAGDGSSSTVYQVEGLKTHLPSDTDRASSKVFESTIAEKNLNARSRQPGSVNETPKDDIIIGETGPDLEALSGPDDSNFLKGDLVQRDLGPGANTVPTTLGPIDTGLDSQAQLQPNTNHGITSLNLSPNRDNLKTGLIDITSPIIDEESDSENEEMIFPPGFTPSKEDLLTLRGLMKEGVSLVPPEHQNDFLKSVDLAEDGEIVEFFQEKFKESTRSGGDTNYMTYHNVRRSPRIKKVPARLSDPACSSGLKKGFLK